MTLDLSNPDRLPFRDLPDEVAAGMVIAARKHGAVAEYFSRPDGGWHAPSEVSWFSNTIYRIRPAPVTADVIPWAHIDPQWKWVARDKSGLWCGYDEKAPMADQELWVAGKQWAALSGIVAGFVQGTCDWRDSLQQRPEGV